jgi:hypothetical protein
VANLLVQRIEKCVERQTARRGALQEVTFGKQLEEGEPAPKRGVEELHATVGSVHGADNPDIRRNREIDSALRQLDSEPPLVLLDQRDQLTEDLRDVASVDLVDQDDIARLRVSPGGVADAFKYPVDQHERHLVFGCLFRPEAFDEVFIGIGRKVMLVSR